MTNTTTKVPPLGQYVDRPDALMPCCPSCGSARVTDPDDEGLQDCLACGIWFDPCLRQELDQWLDEVGARVVKVQREWGIEDPARALEMEDAARSQHLFATGFTCETLPMAAAHLARITTEEARP